MLNVNTQSQAKSTEKLSSGYQINRAADDAAGLAISEKMRRQIKGLTQASANAQDGISMVQTAEGALNEVHDMLQRINQLAVKGENGTLTSADRGYIASEVQQLMSEIDRVQSTTTFNELNLLTGEMSGGTGLQVGAEASQYIKVTINQMSVEKLFVESKGSDKKAAVVDKFYDFDSQKLDGMDSQKTFASLNAATKLALNTVSKQRSDLGAVQNRLEHTINNLDNVVENTTSAESAIRDTDMATEMVRYSNNNILQQAGQAMLAQANQANQGVLSLLG
jgi:flagellin